MRVFLLVNEVEVNASEDELYDLFIGIASGDLRRDAVERWLKARVSAG
jgi:prophage maintenance system killer protein